MDEHKHKCGRLVVVTGPTAGGKTTLALALAEELGAEIVSVDSRQVYRRLDIGTAKPTPEECQRVRHHMIDVAEVDEIFDAARYANEAALAIADIHARGRSVVLCGGTGLYLRALLDGIAPVPPVPIGLRHELTGRLQQEGEVVLHAELGRLDPECAARIGPRDHFRLLRALGVAHATGRALSAWQREHRETRSLRWQALLWVLAPAADILQKRIADRTREMWRSGLLEETRAVLAAGFAGTLPALQAIGYREAQQVLAGDLSETDALSAIEVATRQYAKRQRTWFRAVPEARWLSGNEDKGRRVAEAKEFLGAAV